MHIFTASTSVIIPRKYGSVASFWRTYYAILNIYRHAYFQLFFCQILCVKFGAEELQYIGPFPAIFPNSHDEILSYLKSLSNRDDIMTTDLRYQRDTHSFEIVHH